MMAPSGGNLCHVCLVNPVYFFFFFRFHDVQRHLWTSGENGVRPGNRESDRLRHGCVEETLRCSWFGEGKNWDASVVWEIMLGNDRFVEETFSCVGSAGGNVVMRPFCGRNVAMRPFCGRNISMRPFMRNKRFHASVLRKKRFHASALLRENCEAFVLRK